MRSAFVAAMALFVAGTQSPSAKAQSVDDLNLQVHGYATQGFLYSTNNNWNTTDSTDGSAAWIEAVVNLTVQPTPKLRIGVQGRYYLLGDYGNTVSLDWAQADYKVNELLGFRAGKVKSPIGLFNDIQDIDPAYLWVLLPQSIYPISSRNGVLAHYGGVVYGAVGLGESLGKLGYRAFGGVRVVSTDDGYFQPFRDAGLSAPNGITAPMFGGTLLWNAPVRGLLVGATGTAQSASAVIAAGAYQGALTNPRFFWPAYFGKYERKKFMAASEYSRLAPNVYLLFPGAPTIDNPRDVRSFYGMASYKATEKLTGGLYYSYSLDHKAAFTTARYQKDWALAARYDFSPFLYAKFEQHFMDGAEIGFSTSNNLAGLIPATRMTLLKLGASF